MLLFNSCEIINNEIDVYDQTPIVHSIKTFDNTNSRYTIRFKTQGTLPNQLIYIDSVNKFRVGDTINFIKK